MFLPANNNREVFLTIKADSKMIGLRDRDYLKPNEIIAIRQKFPNLKILQYYAFENYIYHPDNIEELQWKGYSKTDYIQQIIQQKNDRLFAIVDEIATARQTYIEFKDAIKNDDKRDPIINSLRSNDLEEFYPYLNMKKHYNKIYLQQFTYQVKDLVKTNWFKQRIEDLLNN